MTARTLFIGVRTGGVWVCERLHRTMALPDPVGVLDISFYRDDFSRVGLHPRVLGSHLPVDVENREVMLVDDVLHTGRTVRAALNEIFSYGRPSRVRLAVLAERDGRELPIQADVVGHHIRLGADQYLRLRSEGDELRLSVETRRRPDDADSAT